MTPASSSARLSSEQRDETVLFGRLAGRFNRYMALRRTRRQLRDLELAQKSVDERLWRVSSDAVGQARLKDWLTELLKKAGAKNPNLVLSSPRALA